MQHSLGRVLETTWGANLQFPPPSAFENADPDSSHSLTGQVTKVFNVSFRRTGAETTVTNLAVGSSTTTATMGKKSGYLSGKKSKDITWKAVGLEISLDERYCAGFLEDITKYFSAFLGVSSIDQEVAFGTKGDRKTFSFFGSNTLIADLRAATSTNVGDDVIMVGDKVSFETRANSLFINNQTFRVDIANRAGQPQTQHAQSSLYHQKAVDVDAGLVGNIAKMQGKGTIKPAEKKYIFDDDVDDDEWDD